MRLRSSHFVAVLLHLAALSSQYLTCTSHSFLIEPRGDFKTFRKPECRVGGPPHAPNDSCPGPCIATHSWQYDRATVTHQYRRGQVVSMVWGRNNHIGGFVRFSLVPVGQRMSHRAHARMAFRYACFESDKHPCTRPDCGTDTWLYRTDVQIPTSYPDGDYVLSWAWYGGMSFRQSYFGDYYSCVNVRIRGGPSSARYNPIFHPGEKLEGTGCRSAVDRLGICKREPCLGHPEKRTLPFPFSANRTPRPIWRSWLTGETSERSENIPHASPTASKTPTPTPSSTPSLTPSSSPRAVPSPTPKGLALSSVTLRALKIVDAETKAQIAKVRSTADVRIPTKTRTFSAIAVASGDVRSVTFYVNDKKTRTEMYRPYAAWGDIKGTLNAWPSPKFNATAKFRVVAKSHSGQKDVKKFWVRLTR